MIRVVPGEKGRYFRYDPVRMKGDFAETVLMPGDPYRSQMIAENYLKDARLVNDVRGVKGYN